MNRRTSYPAVYALLRTAADIADHYVQTHHQATHKARPGTEGHSALAGHCLSYVTTQAVILGAGNHLLGLDLRPRHMAVALAFSGVTHYALDRRWPLRRFAELIGKREFYELGGPLGGAYLMDQAGHHFAEGIAAYLAVRD